MKSVLASLFSFFLSILFLTPLYASIVCVDDPTNTGPEGAHCEEACGGGNCSLRDAVEAVNFDGATKIIFDPNMAGPVVLDELDLKPLIIKRSAEIEGPGHDKLTIQGDGDGRLLRVNSDTNDQSVTISGLRFTGGNGALEVHTGDSLSVDSVRIDHNNATIPNSNGQVCGGGIAGLSGAIGATVTVENSLIELNEATDVGGGICVRNLEGTLTIRNSTIEANRANTGGGLLFDWHNMLIENSTFYKNAANQSNGGAIDDAGTLAGPQGKKIINTTITGNKAPGQGGGINIDMSNFELINVTMVGNEAAVGGGFHATGSSHTIKNSIIAKNSGGDCAQSANIVSSGYNIDEDNSCNFNQGSDQHADPKVDALKENGGPTRTMALLAGSPALDKIPEADCLPTDQRGYARVAPCDVGAFEDGAQPGTTGGGTTGDGSGTGDSGTGTGTGDSGTGSGDGATGGAEPSEGADASGDGEIVDEGSQQAHAQGGGSCSLIR